MVNGQNFSGTGYQLDGTENRDPILGIIVINPNLEAIGEAKITSQNYDAEFGQATAGVVSVQTKSGTNEFFGSAFEFFQNDSSRRATRSRSRPEDRICRRTSRNQFGFAVGRSDHEEQVVLLRRLPGHAQHRRAARGCCRCRRPLARTGDLSEYGVNIYDPDSSTDPARARSLRATSFPATGCRRRRSNILDADPASRTCRARTNGTRDNFSGVGQSRRSTPISSTAGSTTG